MSKTKFSFATSVIVAGALTAAFFAATSHPDRTISEKDLHDGVLYADIHQSDFKPAELKNVFQDRLGIQVTAAYPRTSNGVNGGMCYYLNISPTMNNSAQYTNKAANHQTDKDAITSIRVKNDLFTINPVAIITKQEPGLFGPTQHSECTLSIARYSDIPTASPLGSQSYKIDSKAYAGNFLPHQKTTMFEGGLTLTVNRAPWFRETGMCHYVATVDGKQIQSPRFEPVAYYVSNNKAYKVDVSQSPSGFTTTSPCYIKVEEFDLMLAGSAYKPPEALHATPNADPKIQAVATRLANENPQLIITRDKAVEIELQPWKIVNLDSDATATLRRSSSLNVEFEMQSTDANNYSGGVNIGMWTASLGKTLGRALTATIKPGDEITAGVDLDGSKCRKWETKVTGIEVHARASAPQIGLPEIPFTYLDSIEYKARNLCTPGVVALSLDRK